MKRFMVYLDYDMQKPAGHVELEEDIPDNFIAECVLGPCILIGANGTVLEVKCFGCFHE